MIKSDKNWVNDISRETKIDSIIWKHSSLINLTTQIQDSTKYLMSNGFYDAKGMLQMNLMLHGQTVNISWNTKQIVGSYSAKQTEWRGARLSKDTVRHQTSYSPQRSFDIKMYQSQYVSQQCHPTHYQSDKRVISAICLECLAISPTQSWLLQIISWLHLSNIIY